MLTCRGLRKTYKNPRGAVEAVRGVDLSFEAGQYAALIGRSGSGKSSLMAMIGGLSRPSAGEVRVDGTDIWLLNEAGMARFRNRRIGYVFQFASLLPTLSALDNVALPAMLGRTSRRADIYGRAAGLLSGMGLEAHAEALPTEMSMGEQRRVAIARALINDPVLLLADEPTSDLDEQTEREILSLLRRMTESRKTTLILVTHNLTVASAAEQIVHIADGQVVA